MKAACRKDAVLAAALRLSFRKVQRKLLDMHRRCGHTRRRNDLCANYVIFVLSCCCFFPGAEKNNPFPCTICRIWRPVLSEYRIQRNRSTRTVDMYMRSADKSQRYILRQVQQNRLQMCPIYLLRCRWENMESVPCPESRFFCTL